jgi:hypothetical protein
LKENSESYAGKFQININPEGISALGYDNVTRATVIYVITASDGRFGILHESARDFLIQSATAEFKDEKKALIEVKKAECKLNTNGNFSSKDLYAEIKTLFCLPAGEVKMLLNVPEDQISPFKYGYLAIEGDEPAEHQMGTLTEIVEEEVVVSNEN